MRRDPQSIAAAAKFMRPSADAKKLLILKNLAAAAGRGRLQRAVTQAAMTLVLEPETPRHTADSAAVCS